MHGAKVKKVKICKVTHDFQQLAILLPSDYWLSLWFVLDIQGDSWLMDIYLLTSTYLLTPWSRVFLEKLTGFQLVKKFPAFYDIRMFITAVTSARHLFLSWASSIQSILPHPTSWRWLTDITEGNDFLCLCEQ